MMSGPGQVEKLPLLYPSDSFSTFNRMESTSSLPGYNLQPPVQNAEPLVGMQYPPVSIVQSINGDQYRQTPVHRPYTPQQSQTAQNMNMNQPTVRQGPGMYQPQTGPYPMPPQGTARSYTPQANPYPPQSRTYTPAPGDNGNRSATPGSYYRNPQ